MTTQKTLSELLEAVEPDIIYHTTGDLVHCADYERMRGVAIELAKACEFYADYKNNYTKEGIVFSAQHCGENEKEQVQDFGMTSEQSLSRAKDIIGGDRE